MRTSNVSYLVKKGITSVWKNFVMSFASFSILLVSLLQISIAVLVMTNIDIIMGNIEDMNQISIFVVEDITDAQLDHIKSVLNNNADLTDVQYISPDEGKIRFNENLGEYAEIMEYLEENPVPHSFFARVKDIQRIRPVVTAVQSIDGVEEVRAPYDFASALQNIRKTFSVIVIGVMATLVLVSIVIISNTIRSSVFARRNEITIMKYVGATNGFIKLPFFVEGMFVGVVAGAASWGLTWFVYDSIFSLFTDNFTLWEMFGFFNLIPFDGVCWTVLGINCAAGALLGAVGTIISMGKYLKV
ncbi:MAG: permease-like cell division protein FtsX [Oscillospiraceae bacterium]|nr:permease-like cell division protein FtsX [Oscillospiraceae bacterium]